MRKKKFPLAFLLIMIFSIAPPRIACGQSEIRYVQTPKETVKQHEVFTADIALAEPGGKPLEPKEAILDAEITMPDGKASSLPAFYSGQQGIWMLRYTPTIIGTYSYRLRLRNGSKNVYSAPRNLSVVSGTSDGFLRKSISNPFYPVFDSGKPFFGIGHNIGWVTNNNISGYEKYFALFKENGCNLTRIWLNTPWTFRIETDKLGTYDFEDSKKLDALLELAKKYDLYLILVFDTYGSLMQERGIWNEQFWKTNPYNSLNGGPCDKPWDFFSNEEAKRYYKNRLRYIVGRWSYSPNIIAFELWNETDAPADWIKEMSGYIKSINPHGQFITTSLGYPWGNNFDGSSIWGMDEIDIIDHHIYGNTTRDMIENIVSVNHWMLKKYNKYIIVGEFGMDSARNDAQIDPDGKAVAFHSSLWSAMITGSFSTSLNWWWAEYVKAKNLYSHYKAIGNFVRNIKWNSGRIEFLEIGPVKCAQDNRARGFSNVVISTTDAWGDTSYKEFRVGNNGELSGGLVNTYLHGTLKQNIKIDPLFHVNYPIPGKFTVRVNTVSQGADLIIKIDGKDALNKTFSAGPGPGPWKRSVYRKDYNIYQCVYDIDMGVDVPAGEHIIQLSNTGSDWISINKITLDNYKNSDFANAVVAGLRVGDEMLFWIYNKGFNWKEAKKGIEPPLIKDAYFIILNIENGIYDIEWWDTFGGKVFSRKDARAINNKLKITLPDLTNDLACKIKRR